ncbi:MAG TPA: GNAT family N-acetyltransferase [Acidimicrobiia bacterium]|nr:GNAT family N-acetyltransferase [Acidimicrobiia bacterium]
MSARRDDGLVVRPAVAADLPAVLDLLGASLGRDDDERYDALYRWKHEENPFGASPAWVADDGGRLAGVRVLMRWEFDTPIGRRRAVRAVDTATHPDYQGRGLFTRLTLHALDELRAEGVDFVFNTPNDQSRPGYLKMGWQVVGRLPAAAVPTGWRGALRMPAARVAAERWSLPTTVGEPAAGVLADTAAVADLLAACPGAGGLATARSPEFLRWRYGTPLLDYRVLVAPGGVRHGLLLFRLRRRGPAREAVLADVLVPGDDARARRRLVGALRRSVDADYVMGLAPPSRALADRMVPLPARAGPILTWRRVAAAADAPPARAEWRVTLGDIELF